MNPQAAVADRTHPQVAKKRSFKVKFFETHDDGEVSFDFIRFQQFTFLQMLVIALLCNSFIAHQLRPSIPHGAPILLKAVDFVLPWVELVGWTAVFYVVASFFEWGFHRYLFHIWPNFMARKHTLHHYMHPTTNYQSHEEHQTESAHFPAHALVSFLAVFTIASLPIQYLMPHQPILLAVNLAVCMGYYRYEYTHAQKHYSIKWQQEQLNDPKTGRAYEQRFVLHFIHHDMPALNMAVFAEDIKSLPDRVFRTYVPGELLRDEKGLVVVKEEDGNPYMTVTLPEVLPKPVWPARILDKLSIRWQKAYFKMFPQRRQHYHF